MPWPRGVPRKGHINKSGQPHARLGRKPIAVLTVERMEETLVYKPKSVPMQKKVERVITKDARIKKYGTKLAHPQYVIEVCPNCDFPEADGGYCPDCGWTRKAIERLPANSVHGKLFKRK